MKSTNRQQKVLKNRITAFTIDLLAIAIFEKLVLLTLKNALNEMMLHASPFYRAEISPLIRSFELPLLLFCYFSYFFLSLVLTNGHTLGKSIMGLKVHRPHAPFSGLSPKEAFMRSCGYFVAYLSMGLLFILPLFNRRRQGIPDWVSGTVVSSEEELLEIAKRADSEASSEIKTAQLLLFPEDPAASYKKSA